MNQRSGAEYRWERGSGHTGQGGVAALPHLNGKQRVGCKGWRKFVLRTNVGPALPTAAASAAAVGRAGSTLDEFFRINPVKCRTRFLAAAASAARSRETGHHLINYY